MTLVGAKSMPLLSHYNFADEMVALDQGGRLCIYGEVSDVYEAFAAENGLAVEYFKPLFGFQR